MGASGAAILIIANLPQFLVIAIMRPYYLQSRAFIITIRLEWEGGEHDFEE